MFHVIKVCKSLPGCEFWKMVFVEVVSVNTVFWEVECVMGTYRKEGSFYGILDSYSKSKFY